jgi:catechol 2,3-dioxygenase-like lactoylglutathione lyase family enzyme
MPLCGIDAVTFGVENLNACRTFLDDWGLAPVSAANDRLVYRTLDGSEVIVRPKDAAELPPAIEEGNTVRQITWGAKDSSALNAVLDRVKVIGTNGSGEPCAIDPNGMSLAFRVSRRERYVAKPTPINSPGIARRVDQRAPIYERARPIQIGHIVCFAGDYSPMREFYLNVLGFFLSDEYPGHGAFMRCGAEGGHHNMFVLNRPGRPGINHVAFTVNDIHEVIGGGIAMAKCGWKTEIGPGRHPISSAYFWYFENPLGPPLEYYADEDYCTDRWVPSTFERKPELFAEWAIDGGINPQTRRQAVNEQASQRGHK